MTTVLTVAILIAAVMGGIALGWKQAGGCAPDADGEAAPDTRAAQLRALRREGLS